MGLLKDFISRRRFVKVALGSALTLTAAGVGTGLYATQVEPFAVDLVRLDLPVERLPSALVGQTLVQISDTHVGSTCLKYLAETLDRVAALKPAVVVITGDLTDDGTPEQQRDLFGLLQGRTLGQLATVAILGNHDFHAKANAESFRPGLARAGVKLLRNEHCVVEGLHLIGLDDLWKGVFRPQDVMPQRDRRAATVVLSHNPDSADRPVWAGYRGWILCGHTHGGQVRVPGLGPPFVPVDNKRYVAGEYDVGEGRRMYINRGLGYSQQVRLVARPEITAFTLQRT